MWSTMWWRTFQSGDDMRHDNPCQQQVQKPTDGWETNDDARIGLNACRPTARYRINWPAGARSTGRHVGAGAPRACTGGNNCEIYRTPAVAPSSDDHITARCPERDRVAMSQCRYLKSGGHRSNKSQSSALN